ncbi:MAG: DNA-binding protein [Spirochaetae bacterium HGW-Spirochaetae-10]|nr:MAG: DNA-binding protein [Spirochaetae bacterium HGW-Spirochaetae-10]
MAALIGAGLQGFESCISETIMNSVFQPDWLSPPGDTIADVIEERGWDQKALGRRLGYTSKHISQLINGKAPITDETAVRLENVLGSSARFWMNREANYRAALATIEETKQHRQWISWTEKMPVKELMKIGAIPKRRLVESSKSAIVKDLLQFFSVASPGEWEQTYGQLQASFRRTRKEQSNTGSITAWLRLGELRAQSLEAPAYNESRFKKVLDEIRTLTIEESLDFEAELRYHCASAGVLFVLVPAIPGAHVSGVARWLSKRRPMIQLSLYGKKNDRCWFSFFHEAGHILFHRDHEDRIFLDDFQAAGQQSEEEEEANKFASRILIPEKYEEEMRTLHSRGDVIAFAETIGIHPGIVVGRLQHEKIIRQDWLNDLKGSFRFSEHHARQ